MRHPVTGKRYSFGVTLATAALYLGVSEKTAYRMHIKGLLHGQRQRQGGYIYVRRITLERFVSSPVCWLYIQPRNIADPELRTIAVQARAATPGRWWSTSELADAYYVHPARVRAWRRSGWMAGKWASLGRTSGGWWLWVTSLPPAPMRRDLDRPSIEAKRRVLRSALSQRGMIS